MVDAAVSFAIQNLSDFLSKEVNTRRGAKDGVRWLRDELRFLQSSVRAAEANQQADQILLPWIDNVKDVAIDAVVILERFNALQEQAHREQGVLDRLCSCIFICKKQVNLYDIGKEIESVKGRVIEIKNRRQEWGINNILDSTPMVQQRKRTLLRATSFENHVDVVGLEDDVNTLLAEIHKEDPSLSVISIHGMGGLGKTTLASKLYHSTKLSYFKSHAWACVSEEYNIKDVLKTIIKSLVGQELGHELDLIMKMNEVDLLRHLRKLLEDGGPYLAVIDDVWDIKAWEKIRKVFPDKENGSRIIITTRNKNVAQRVDDRCFVHELRFLREDESWQLFCKRAKPTTPILEKLGVEMVKKCGGLPLAIEVLSGLLLHNEDWSKVKDHIWTLLKGNSVEIKEILSLSYDELSLQMRECFLYLARFPEDHNFRLNNLKHLWIAEGFITEADEGDGVVMEDVAEDYLNELINRNMVQIAALFWDGQVAVCRVHDLVRELAIQKATESKLLGIFDSSKQHLSSKRLLHGQPRHAIYNGIGEYLKLLGPTSDYLNLSSLALINKTGSHVEIEDIKLMYTRFKYLKMLDLTSVKSNGIPEEIGDLIFLKFLGLVCSSISEKALVIPHTIGKLKKLQTLCGSESSQYDFPIEICELRELRHLDARGSNIGRHQTKLQTLSIIQFENWISIDTVNLTNLHTLFIEDFSTEENAYTLDSIAILTSLQTFFLDMTSTNIPTIRPLSSCIRLKKVSLLGRMKDQSELSFLPESVTDLTLHGSDLTHDPMSILANLSNLTGLDLRRVYTGKKMVCRPDAFPSLQIFRLRDLPYLEEWQVEEGALRSLKGFEIDGCDKLKMVPQIVKCVPTIPNRFLLWN